MLRAAHRARAASLLAALDEIGEIPLPPYIEAARRRLGAGRAGGRRSRALPDGLRARPGRRRRADRRPALHARRCSRPRARPATRSRSSPCTSGRGRFGRSRPTIPARTGWSRATTGSRPRRRRRSRARAARGGRWSRSARRWCARSRRRRARTAARSRRGRGRPISDLLPGARFEVVTDLITNFHLPRSTLLMLVAAFAGREQRPRRLPRGGRAAGYRFYSYGDAMLIRAARGDARPARSGSSRAPAARAPACSRRPHGAVETPVFMPVGTQATVKALSSEDVERLGAADHPRQHLSPGAAARGRAHRGARRPAPVHELAARHPDRLGRLPGVQPARAADDRRRRGHVPLAPRRQRAAPDARAGDGDPGGARQRHRDGLRRVPAVGRAARRDRGGDGAHEPLGAALPRGAERRPGSSASASCRAACTSICGAPTSPRSRRCRSTGSRSGGSASARRPR